MGVLQAGLGGLMFEAARRLARCSMGPSTHSLPVRVSPRRVHDPIVPSGKGGPLTSSGYLDQF